MSQKEPTVGAVITDCMRKLLVAGAVVGLAGAAYWYLSQEEEKPKNMGCLESKPDAEVGVLPACLCPVVARDAQACTVKRATHRTIRYTWYLRAAHARFVSRTGAGGQEGPGGECRTRRHEHRAARRDKRSEASGRQACARQGSRDEKGGI